MQLRTLLYLSCLLMCASASAKVFKFKSMEQYNKAFMSDTPMITMFTSVTCGPCKMMKPSFHKMAASHSEISFYLLDAGDKAFSTLMDELEIRSLPTLIFCHKGEKLMTEVGSMGTKTLGECIDTFQEKLKQKADKQSVKKNNKKPVKKGSKKETSIKTQSKAVSKKK